MSNRRCTHIGLLRVARVRHRIACAAVGLPEAKPCARIGLEACRGCGVHIILTSSGPVALALFASRPAQFSSTFPMKRRSVSVISVLRRVFGAWFNGNFTLRDREALVGVYDWLCPAVSC